MREGRASGKKMGRPFLSGHLEALLATHHSSLSCSKVDWSDRSEQEIEESSLIDVN